MSNQESLEQAIAAWNRGDLEQYLHLYGAEVVLHGYAGVQPGLANLRRFYEAWWVAFPGSQLVPEDMVVAGDRVACRFRIIGTQAGHFQGLPPSGRPISIAGCTILRFNDGACVERWSLVDSLDLLTQIGGAPGASTGSAPAPSSLEAPSDARSRPKSGPVVICAWRSEWAAEFSRLAERLRALVGNAATRIDHVGSTAVPGLAAKDVIDVQITVADLGDPADVLDPLRAAGFRQGESFWYDEFRSMAADDVELRKLYMREPEGERRVHLHIREAGRFNQRFALLFRDYLRASEAVRAEYEVLKRRAAALFPDDIDGYLDLKAPVFGIIYAAADQWAEAVGWRPGDDHT